MGWLDRIRQAGELLSIVERAIQGARSIAEARELLGKAAERGDLDEAFGRVLAGQRRAERFERTGQ